MVFCYSDEENARIYAVHLTTANQRQDVQSAILSLRKLVDSKWAWREIGKRKNPRRGRGKRKKSRKTCGKGDRNADNAVGLFMRDLSVFSESTQVLQFKLKGSLFVFDRSFVIDCLLL